MKYFSILLVLLACNAAERPNSERTATASAEIIADTIVPPQYDNGKLVKVIKTDEQWKKELTETEYHVLRQEGTERAFTGDLWNSHEKGTFTCSGCGLALFSSDTKFESGTGWPSFYQPLKAEHVTENKDESFGMARTEVECARCGGHQGHVFDDGPKPTGLRYCINAAALDFVKQ